MARAIRNPVQWGADQVKSASGYVESVGSRLGSEAEQSSDRLPRVGRVEIGDLRGILKRGLDDFTASRTDVAVLCVIYPAVGLLITWAAFDRNMLPLLFPAMSGFALFGPIAAIGMYEISRRRERGEPANWSQAFRVLASPSFGAIFVLGLLLAGLFLAWVFVAEMIYYLTFGAEVPASLGSFLRDVVTTDAGWALIGLGIPVGFLFAVATLVVSVVSFPLLLDRNVGLPAAVLTSYRVSTQNAPAIAAWGLIVAVALAVGSLPLFLGLIVVIPVLGHATWHLYRKAVLPEPSAAA
jgi:uncharacterized membrane protein